MPEGSFNMPIVYLSLIGGLGISLGFGISAKQWSPQRDPVRKMRRRSKCSASGIRQAKSSPSNDHILPNDRPHISLTGSGKFALSDKRAIGGSMDANQLSTIV